MSEITFDEWAKEARRLKMPEDYIGGVRLAVERGELKPYRRDGVCGVQITPKGQQLLASGGIFEGFTPFNDSDPFDTVAELFRTQVVEMVIKAADMPLYRGLSQEQQLQAFISGAMSGLIGVCFSSLRPEGYDEIMKVLAGHLPTARLQVEAQMASQAAQPSAGHA